MTKTMSNRKTKTGGRPRLPIECKKIPFPLRLRPLTAERWHKKARSLGISTSDYAEVMLDMV